MRKPKKTTSFASWQLSTGKAGDVFYSEKENRYITGLAIYHRRKVKTERLIAVSTIATKPQTAIYLTKVTILE
jgi:hypothetical protein